MSLVHYVNSIHVVNTIHSVQISAPEDFYLKENLKVDFLLVL